MLTTKKWVVVFPAFLGLILAGLGLAGCRPSGPTLAREGVRLIEQGKYERAIEKLVAARERLPGNAQLWNHLGLAYHGAYQISDAVNAYQQALRLDPNLAVAHYNLGCLWLEQGDYAKAAEQLKSYTLLQPESVDGWLRLATAQFRDRKLDAAERSFAEVLKRAPANVEALNSMGVLQLQRKRVREAAQSFNAALARNPNYGPALLNLAVVYHQYLNNRPLALQKYHEYLALGTPPNAPAVQETVRQLEQELHVTPRAPATDQVAQAAVTNAPPRATNVTDHVRLAAPPTITPPAKTNQSAGQGPAPPPLQTGLPAIAPKTNLPPPLRTSLQRPVESPSVPEKPPEPAKLQPASPQKLIAKAPPTTPELAQAPEPVPTGQPGTGAEAQKSSRWRYVNPLNWFGSRKPPSITTPLPELPGAKTTSVIEFAARIPADTSVKSENVPPKVVQPTFARYSCLSPAKPKPGNHSLAEERFVAGVEAHKNRRLAQAVAAYQAATRADPAYFDAYYNWALAACELGDLKEALTANEYALALNPASAEARYNFALALQKANYPVDAAQELEKVVLERPSETRAFLNLGNLYAQTLSQPEQARSNYTRVLQLDPRHPQGTAIRYWLASNP